MCPTSLHYQGSIRQQIRYPLYSIDKLSHPIPKERQHPTLVAIHLPTTTTQNPAHIPKQTQASNQSEKRQPNVKAHRSPSHIHQETNVHHKFKPHSSPKASQLQKHAQDPGFQANPAQEVQFQPISPPTIRPILHQPPVFRPGVDFWHF